MGFPSRRAFLIGCWVALATCAISSQPQEATPDSSGVEARLSVKGNPVQGNPLFVQVTGAPRTQVEISWGGERFRVGKTDAEGVSQCLVPISVDLGAGAQVLEAHVGDARVSKTLQVGRRTFPLQRLSISPDTLASYSNPQNQADDQAILSAIRRNQSPKPLWKGNFRIPCQAPETTGFGQRRLYNGWKKGWHKGLDLGGWEGQPIYAPAAGRVAHVARGIVNGNTVVLSHGCGLGTVYLHMNSVQVEEGETVQAGETLGTVGGTGGFSPHLHWEARVWGVPIDPKSLFQIPQGWR